MWIDDRRSSEVYWRTSAFLAALLLPVVSGLPSSATVGSPFAPTPAGRTVRRRFRLGSNSRTVIRCWLPLPVVIVQGRSRPSNVVVVLRRLSVDWPGALR